jgi:tetratricopeptide (TPR) repeat protein
MKDRFFFLAVVVALLFGLILTYANHFHNDFHFDDWHTIISNSYISNLNNTFAFFTDARTFSALPANQSYRPLFSLSVAIDYALGGGLNPFYFHLSDFCWFLAQLFLMFFLFKKIFDLSYNHAWNKWLALFGVAWYGFHTVNAETINYISARSDLISTALVVLSLVIYIYYPLQRKFYFYLVPFLLGVLMKSTAVILAPLLFIYIVIFEDMGSEPETKSLGSSRVLEPLRCNIGAGSKNSHKCFSALLKSLPAFIIAILFYFFQKGMTPATFYPSNIPAFNYLITQPFVCLYYFKSFFLPFGLSADYDWQALATVFDLRLLWGLVFIIAMLAAAFHYNKRKMTGALSFGICWFFLALLPTSSFVPLSEVLNDHRMFFPFVGLMITVCWVIGLLLYKYEAIIRAKISLKIMIIAVCFLVLLANALGTIQRNRVWRTEESLWYDVTIKSPKNGRGLMNYGLSLMKKGDYARALKYYNEALKYVPRYSSLHTNLGIVKAALGNNQEAEGHFKKSLEYGPDNFIAYYFYASWLTNQGRAREAIPLLNRSIALSPGYLPARQLLAVISPAILNQIKSKKPTDNSTPEDYLNFSLDYYNVGLYKESIAAARQALKLRPNYAAAYNNIGAAYNALKMWDEAIPALEKALKLDPNFQLARNNLAWARRQRLKK